MTFRKLKPEEITIRIGTVTASGVSLLLYKDARVDMQILDETVGPMQWQREHYELKGNLFCRVGIFYNELDTWVWKSDCGVESQTEKEKGESSDSFKRACVCWGIGRELYTAPFIWLPLTKEFYESTGDRPKLTRKAQSQIAGFKVSEITYDEKGEIKKLVIIDRKGTVVWQI